MKILSLEISNILSIESAKITFSDNGLVLVEGWNHDAGRANGAGKTAIFNALAFALYDRIPRKVTASEVVRRGAKTGFALAEVSCGNEVFTVKRSRPKGVEFQKDGIAQQWTQEEWESKLRLTYDQFLLSMYAAQGSVSRFLSTNDADKKNFILQLLNLDRFSTCKKTADDIVKGFILEKDADGVKLASIEAKIDAYSDSLIDIEQTTVQVTEINESTKALEQQLKEVQAVAKPDLSKYLRLEEQLLNKQKEFSSIKTKKTMLHEQYRKLNSKVKPFDGANSCYACGSSVDTSDAKATHEKEMEVLKAEALTIKTQIDQCDETLYKESSILEVSRKLKEQKATESAAYQLANQKAIELQMLIKSKQNQAQNLVIKLENNSDLVNKIEVLQKSQKIVSNRIHEKTREIELYKTISAMYSPTGAQAYVLDSVVESFNERVVSYIDMVWPNVTYKLNSFKENAKGDVVARFSESLIMNGKEVSLGSLSGGELKALSLCADFAILDVLESYFGLPLNPIILDEPFDGLDDTGREIVIELLEKLSRSRQIFIVDHASEVKAMFSQIVKVEKRGGVSTVHLEM